MQWDRSAAQAAVLGSARGLGVCDVLRVELAAVQHASLLAALDARIAASRGERRRLLERMRADPAPSALVGPAGLVLELVRACLADAVRALAEELSRNRRAAEAAALATAGAWIATALDCAAVDGFCFEAGLDPPHPW